METATIYKSPETAIANDLTPEPDPRTAQDLWDMYCLESLEPDAKLELITLLLTDQGITPNDRRRLAEGIDPDPEKFNYKLWDCQAFSLSQNLWQIESIVGLAVRAVDRDSELGDELHGALMAIAEICNTAQTTLEMDVMRPVEKQFKGN